MAATIVRIGDDWASIVKPCGTFACARFLPPLDRSSEINLDRVMEWGDRLEEELYNIVSKYSGVEELKNFYRDHNVNLNVVDVDGQVLVQQTAKEIDGLLSKKMKALETVVSAAEDLALNYTYDPDLAIEDVHWYDAKNLADGDPILTYIQGASSAKDMMILIDNSGSVHGLTLTLIKRSVQELLKTLGENDFVNMAWFNTEAHYVSCFDTFVQANVRNKKVLEVAVLEIGDGNMSDFGKGLEFAFRAFDDFNATHTSQGARCNKIIMLFTDGGTERPVEVFEKYNKDRDGMGMMTTITLPVYNKSLGLGYLSEPPNVDFLEVEPDNPSKEEVRKNMIDRASGAVTIETFVRSQDERYVDLVNRTYIYGPMNSTIFSLGLVLPEYRQKRIEVENIDIPTGRDYLQTQRSALFIAPWNFCDDVLTNASHADFLQDILEKLSGFDFPAECDEPRLKHLLLDTIVTERLAEFWNNKAVDFKSDGIVATFVSTEGGITRVFPESECQDFEDRRDTWQQTFFRRSLDNNYFIYSVPYNSDHQNWPVNYTIMATSSVTLNDMGGIKPAVVGVKLDPEIILGTMLHITDQDSVLDKLK
uniref:VWFA domain-containing protein n=1 Tax=Branchiostoma floridae TaxID=7739 RepID=C3Z2M2_BRAFL|eukprot:XP_002597261.1 hypothetical protein BRAFLDRAFT_66396 [Branchiostoma floridae]